MKLLFSYAYIFTFLILAGCNKESIAPIPNETSFQIKPFNFSEEEIASVGSIHNGYLEDSYATLTVSGKTSARDELASYFDSVDIDFSLIGHTPRSLRMLSGKEYDSFRANKFLLTPKHDYDRYDIINPYLINIYNALENVGSLKEFEKSMTLLYHNLEQTQDLTAFEVEVLKITIAVAKSSAALWMPVSMGGKGLIHPKKRPSLLKNCDTDPEEDADVGENQGDDDCGWNWNWGGAVAGDISGATSAVLWLGIEGAATAAWIPGSNAVILGGIGFSAAFGSAVGGIL